MNLHRHNGRAGRGRGFTIVEILVAIVVTMIGFAAIFQMQIGSMQGNITAREMAAASNLAERYVEVLRRDAYQWVGFDLPPPFLSQAAQNWHSFTARPVDQNGLAFAEDLQNGADEEQPFGSNLPRQRFCVHYWLEPGQGVYDGIMSARVRVVWPRSTVDQGNLATACEDAATFEERADLWFTLTVPATIRRHPN